MSDSNRSTVDDTMQSGSGKSATDKVKSGKNKFDKTKKAWNKLKSIKSLAPLVSIISTIGIILLILFLIIGCIGFLVTLPGLAMDKILEACKNLWRNLTGDDAIVVEGTQVTDLANYIENMGYDLVGYGFTSDSSITRDNNGKVTEIDTEKGRNNLYLYVLSNERTYNVQGVNRGLFLNIFGQLDGLNLFTNLDKLVRSWWTNIDLQYYGLIKFDSTDPNSPTRKGYDVTIDRDSNEMMIKSGNILFGWDQMKWDLTGWTSRYGKPIELSLALHLSTMAPDFVADFCSDEELQTTVNMSAHEVTYTMDYQYQSNEEGATPATKEEVNATYDKLKENIPGLERTKQLFNDDVKIDITPYEHNIELTSKLVYPVDVFDDTSIIQVVTGNVIKYENGKMQEDSDGSLKYEIDDDYNNANDFYKAVFKNKEPVRFRMNFGNLENKYYRICNLDLKDEEVGYPYFEDATAEEYNNDARVFKLKDLILPHEKKESAGLMGWAETYVSKTKEGERNVTIRINLMSIKDLFSYCKMEDLFLYEYGTSSNLMAIVGHNYDLEHKYEAFYRTCTATRTGDNSGINNGKSFYLLYKYESTLEALDNFINDDLVGHKTDMQDSEVNVDISMDIVNYENVKSNGELEGKNIKKFNSLDDIPISEYNKHNAKDIFEKIRNNDDKNTYEEKIDALLDRMYPSEGYGIFDWINEEVTYIKDNNIVTKVKIALSQVIKNKLKEWKINGNTFIELHDIYSSLKDSITTYKPYIVSVTNHWYKDLEFRKSGRWNKFL